MSEAIGTIRSAMHADADALRIIAQNIANAEVTAYRRQIPLSAGGFDQLVSSIDASGGQIASNAAAVIQRSMAIDSQPGTLKSTGQPLDVALEGEGFFILQSAAGPLLTRRGDFHVSADGVLSAVSGEPVLGNGGPIQVGFGTPVVGVDGAIRVNGELIDQLRIAQVTDEAELQYLGGGLYSSTATLQDAETYPAVRQGFLETSNVTPVNEMVQMMETLRHFEAAQRLVHGYDQMLEKAISELGKVG
jgi:flagellar basal-body rod protein FlgF